MTSKAETFWSSFGKFAVAFPGCVWAAVQLYGWITTPQSDVRGEASYSVFAVPPTWKDAVKGVLEKQSGESLKKTFSEISQTNPSISEIPYQLPYLLSEKFLLPWPNQLASLLDEFESTLFVKISNNGTKQADKARIVLAGEGLAVMKDRGGSSNNQIFDRFVDLGTLLPGEKFSVIIWLKSRLFDSDLESIRLIDEIGSTRIRIVGEPWVTSKTLSVLFQIVCIGTSLYQIVKIYLLVRSTKPANPNTPKL